MRAALIDQDKVINIIEIPEGGLPEDWLPGMLVRELSNEQISVGWTWDGSEYSAPIIVDPVFDPPTENDLLIAARDEASRLSVIDKIIADDLSNATAEIVSPLFLELDLNGASVNVNEVFRWNGTLVQVIQAHTTQPDWTPESTPSLFKLYRNIAAGAQPWVQPTGAHDAYAAGSSVTHNGETWVNTHGDGNVWEPGVFGWAIQ